MACCPGDEGREQPPPEGAVLTPMSTEADNEGESDRSEQHSG